MKKIRERDIGLGERELSITGIALLFVGIVILLGNIYPGLTIQKLWPLFFLIPIVIQLDVLLKKGKNAAGVLIPVVILSVLMIYFLILNFLGWHLVSTTWPTFMLAPALGLLTYFLVTGNRPLLTPSIILTILAVIFYGSILQSTNVLAVLFVIGGLVLIILPGFKSTKKK